MTIPKAPADAQMEGPDSEIRSDLPREQTVSRAGRRELAGKLAGKSLLAQVYILAIWPFMEQMLNFMVGFVDMVLAARLPHAIAATNAITVGGYVMWLMNLLHMAVGVGSTAIIARAIGARHRRLANAALGQSLILAVSWGIIVGLTICFCAPWIAALMGLEPAAAAMCVTYLRIIALSTPMAAILFVGNASLRGAGDTFTPFTGMVAVNLVNTSLAASLVYLPAPIGGHGVTGIAIATSTAWTLGAVIILYRLLKGSQGLKLRLFRLKPRLDISKRIVRIGAPFLLESVGQWGGNFLILKIVALFPAVAMSAHMITIRIEAISYLPGYAIGAAAATLCGQYLGLGDHARARKAVMICWTLTIIIMTTMGLVFITIPHTLARIVTDEPQLYQAVPPLLHLVGFVQFFFGTYLVFSQALRGAGATRTTAIAGNISILLIRLPLVYFLAVVMDLGLMGVWYGLCIELVIRGTGFSLLFFFSKWQNSRV